MSFAQIDFNSALLCVSQIHLLLSSVIAMPIKFQIKQFVYLLFDSMMHLHIED